MFTHIQLNFPHSIDLRKISCEITVSSNLCLSISIIYKLYILQIVCTVLQLLNCHNTQIFIKYIMILLYLSHGTLYIYILLHFQAQCCEKYVLIISPPKISTSSWQKFRTIWWGFIFRLCATLFRPSLIFETLVGILRVTWRRHWRSALIRLPYSTLTLPRTISMKFRRNDDVQIGTPT